MRTKQSTNNIVQDMRQVGGIGEDRGGIPVIAGLTFLMLAVVLFAIGFLLFNAPSAGTTKQIDANRPLDYIQGSRPGSPALPSERGPTIDQNL